MSTILPGTISATDCSARGGYRTVMPSGPSAGQPACRSGSGSGLTYQLLQVSFSDWLRNASGLIGENVDVALGTAVEKRDEVVEATGLRDGAVGVASKVLGVDLKFIIWAFVALLFFIVYKGEAGAIVGAARGRK